MYVGAGPVWSLISLEVIWDVLFFKEYMANEVKTGLSLVRVLAAVSLVATETRSAR